MTALPMDPGRVNMPVDVRIEYLVQDKFFLDRYPLTVRLGPDEHDRSMLSSACSDVIDRHRAGRVFELAFLGALESDVAAFLKGGAALRRRNRDALRMVGRMKILAPLADNFLCNLAAAYRPEVP